MAAIGEDSSGQEMKKKHAVGKDRRRGGHEVPRGLEPPLDSEALTDQGSGVASAGRDHCQRGMKAKAGS